jgi:aflatoxin B1 aldehyde reductase
VAASSILPTVYSSNYNAVARHPETTLFPLLCKLKMSFYAYSPVGGGFLVKDAAQLRAGKVEGRFGWDNIVGDLYRTLYCKESILAALDEWEEIARDAEITKAALAYRWITYNSMLKGEHGDAIIMGTSTAAQLLETLSAIEAGPLDEETAKRVDALWGKIEHEAPSDYYHDYLINLGNPTEKIH